MSRRYFEYTDAKSNKFWAISISESSTTVEWGRIGTNGQSKTKDFGSASEAQASYDKLVKEKTKEGYKELGSAAPPASPVAQASKPAPAKPAPAKPAPAKPAPAKQTPELTPKQTPAKSSAGAAPAIDISPSAWRWATWRKHAPAPLPAPKPFDLNDCCERAARAKVGTYGWDWDWSACEIAPVMSREEAHYWVLAMTTMERGKKPRTHAFDLPGQTRGGFTGKLDLQGVKKYLSQCGELVKPVMIRPLLSLLDFEEVVDLAFTVRGTHQQDSEIPMLVPGLLDHLPYLDAKQVDALRARCKGSLDPKTWPSDFYKAGPIGFYVAARVGGFADELRALVESWPDDRFSAQGWHSHYQAPQLIVFGLGSAELVEQHMRRLKLRPDRPEYIHAWLAHTGAGALDLVRDTILGIKNRDEEERLIAAFAAVHAAEAAPHFLELKRSSKAPRAAGDWLDQNLPHAIPGLLATASGRGALAEAAVEFLRTAKRGGHADLIEKAVKGAPSDVAAKVRELVLDHEEKTYPPLEKPPSWLSLPAGAKTGKSPAWSDASQLPPLAVSGKQLKPEHVEIVLGALRASPLAERLPILTALREHGEPATLDAFAWKLFELWLGEGAPSKEKWALHAIGFLGSDACALKLAPMVRVWPGESQHARAVVGLECLRAIGSDVALMQLNGIAQKLKFKGLKNKAQELMEAIAKDRGMTRPELEDRIVPDCDLDEKGSRVFDFGPRQFSFALGPDMKPMLRDAAGKLVGDLPKPGAKDDAEKASDAVATWKLMKKQIKEVAKIQAERLEQSMVTGRRWKTADFETLLVKHPLMTHLVRLLVLGGYDEKDKLVGTFRVTEDGTYADSKDEATKLKGATRVGIMHPLDLTDDLRAQWGQVFGDYQILPPFPQLARPVLALEKDEAKGKEIHRNKGKKVAAATLSGTLDRLGWERGIPQDAGIYCAHSKPFHGAGVTAVVTYGGIPIGYMVDWEDQEVESCYFLSGIHGPQGYPETKQAIALSKVDRIAVSEVLKDLATLAEKAK
jgi:predicted DNA-binding WGR domain protein